MIRLVGRLEPAGVSVSGFSTEMPAKYFLAIVLLTRKLYCLAHTKPALYCASIVCGRISVPRVRPWGVSGGSDQPCPPEMSQPLLNLASAHSWRWRMV